MNRSMSFSLMPLIKGTAHKRGLIFGLIILGALLAFEIFNFSSTSFALRDVLGDLTFGGVRWATMLAFAFCAIDFAGIARIFTPEQGRDEPAEVWYLFAAWFLAAAFNATLTWWGVSIAVMSHNVQGGALVGQPVLLKAVPVFVAAMVLIIRVLLINTFSIAGERLFSLAENRASRYQNQTQSRPAYRPQTESLRTPNEAPAFPRPAPRPTPAASTRPLYNEPSYHPVGMSARERSENSSVRR
ncbi:MAG: hypothetical protein M3Y68_03530 [Chloroflexota bacterium]|nr:hypothetical protein [Chloroflexota bacterium]